MHLRYGTIYITVGVIQNFLLVKKHFCNRVYQSEPDFFGDLF